MANLAPDQLNTGCVEVRDTLRGGRTMRARQTCWIAVGVGLMSMGCSATGMADRDAFEAAAKELAQDYSVAVDSGDVNLYVTHLDDNAIYMAPGAPEHSGRAAVGRALGEWFAAVNFEEFAVNLEEFEVFGDFGYIRGTYSCLTIPWASGDTTRFEGKVLSILRRQPDGSWRIYRDCFNSNGLPAI